MIGYIEVICWGIIISLIVFGITNIIEVDIERYKEKVFDTTIKDIQNGYLTEGGIKINSTDKLKDITIYTKGMWHSSTLNKYCEEIGIKEAFDYYENNDQYDNITLYNSDHSLYLWWKHCVYAKRVRTNTYIIRDVYKNDKFKLGDQPQVNFLNIYFNIDVNRYSSSSIGYPPLILNYYCPMGREYLLANKYKYPKIFIAYMEKLEFKIKSPITGSIFSPPRGVVYPTNHPPLIENDSFNNLVDYYMKNNSISDSHLTPSYINKIYSEKRLFLNDYLKLYSKYNEIKSKTIT